MKQVIFIMRLKVKLGENQQICDEWNRISVVQ